MEFKDYYRILSIVPTATADEIKKAYRTLARKYHPDVSKEPHAEQRMSELNEANAVLSDPAKRMAYDTLSAHATHNRGNFQAPPGWDAGFDFSGTGAEAGTSSTGGSGSGSTGHFSDFFEHLFGRAARAQRAHTPHSPSEDAVNFDNLQEIRPGRDQHSSIQLDILDSYHGSDRTIELHGSRLDGSGHAVLDKRSLQVKVPKGIREGQTIRLIGQGQPGTGGAPAGHLLLEVHFVPNARWRIEDRDVYQRLLLAPWEAALGASVEVPTPIGVIEVAVPGESHHGRKLRLKGRGLPSVPPGDLYLELEIVQPPAQTDEARAAYTALAKAFPRFHPRQA